MEQYNVTGMSCAACSARVEKAVNKVPGVTSCSVSLLTNSMGVEGTASASAIVSAVEEAGYGCSLKGASGQTESVSDAEKALEDHETPLLRKRLIASVGFLLVLMYFSMGHMMWGWPLPAWFDGQPYRHGTCTAASCRNRHGHQPEIFHQWLQESVAPLSEHGYPGSSRLHGLLCMECLRPVRHDQSPG